MTAPQLTYRTSDATRWGNGQNTNLNAGEIDANFYALAQAIVSLQQNPAQPVGIASVTVSGTQMSIVLTNGAVLGPFTLPVLQFRWRGAWEPNTGYAALDTFTVAQVGIFSVMEAHTSAPTFNALATGPDQGLLYNQLFGAVDASLSGLTDVRISSLVGGQVLFWNANDNFWENENLGSMAFQQAGSVAITGGSIANVGITGLPAPLNASDACTKAYADALQLGIPSIADGLVMANMTGNANAPVATSVSAILDHVFTTTRGALLYRTGTGWTFLGPGTVGQVLKSGGAGADVSWGPVAAGVTDIAAGTGISTGGSDITTTGSISLAAIATGNILANISGSSAAPTAQTLSAIIDSVAGNLRGSILFRGASGWTTLGPGTTGLYLKTQGSAADPVWSSPAGAGTVTDIAAGTGISTGGADITATGTISLAAIADSTFLANVSGASAAPSAQTITQFLDHVFTSPAQGSVIYRDATSWKSVGPGTSGQVLTTGGAAANPSWANAPSGGPVSDKQILANISGASAAPIGKNITDVLDYVFSSSQGALLYRGASGWSALGPGTTGQFLQTGGSSGNPSWASAGSGSSVPDGQILSNISGGPAVAAGHSVSDTLDHVFGSTRSAMLFRGGTGWTLLNPGTAGQLLQTGTSSADPSWITPSGGAGGVTSLTGGNNIAVSSATGAVTLSSNSINPTGADADLVTWASIEGLRWKYTCTCATTAALPACTYANGTSGVGATLTATANGALTVDTHSLSAGDIILVKTQASAFQNGMYLCTQPGSVSTPFILTRAPWNDDAAGSSGYTKSMAPGDVTAILLGSQAGTVWMQTNLGSAAGSNIVVGTDNLSYSQIGGTNVVTSGGGAKYNVSCFVPGAMSASQKLLYHKLSRAVTFPANFGSSAAGHASEAGGSTNATASTVINVDKAAAASPNTFSNVGTITIGASGVTATLATSGGSTVTFSQGDVLRIVGPASADATFADFYATLSGVEA